MEKIKLSEKYIFGAIDSPEDKRDYSIVDCMEVAKGTYEQLPYTYMDMWKPEIRNQGEINSCTAYAMTTILACIHHKLYSYDDNYSVGGCYGNRLDYGWTREGDIMRDVVKKIQKYGDFLAKDFECFDEVKGVIDKFNAEYKKNSDKMKKLVKSYIRIKNKKEAKAFLCKYKIPLFVSVNATSIVGLGSGRHAIACYGYDGGLFYCQNSWGEEDYPNPKFEFEEFNEVWGIVPMEEIKFTDIENDRWSKEAIEEATKDGIFDGFPDGTFKPEESLTREQAAVFWHRIKKHITKD